MKFLPLLRRFCYKTHQNFTVQFKTIPQKKKFQFVTSLPFHSTSYIIVINLQNEQPNALQKNACELLSNIKPALKYFRASSHDLYAWIKKTNLTQRNLPPGQNINSPYSRYKTQLQTYLYFVYEGAPPDKVLKQ